jgi:hypothetical protein
VGVPEVVAYLNSINVPRVVRLKTLVGKIVCTILSVSGSMTLGPEGTHRPTISVRPMSSSLLTFPGFF